MVVMLGIFYLGNPGLSYYERLNWHISFGFILCLVLAGDSDRYASTHRVSRSEGHTFSYIHKRCCNVLQQVFNCNFSTI